MARTKENNTVTYNLNGIPGDVWDRAKAKAASYRPPLSMRWVIIQLLEKFAPASEEELAATAAANLKKIAPVRAANARRAKEGPKPPKPPAPSLGDAVDLGDSF